MQEHGLEYREDLVISRTSVDIESTEQGAQAMQILLDRKLRPDGVFCFNDPLAIGAMKTIRAAGLKVPDDVAVIGCGNLHYDDSLWVELSSVDQHSSQIGRQAAELVLSLIEAKQKARPRSHVLAPVLVVRASTQRKTNSPESHNSDAIVSG